MLLFKLIEMQCEDYFSEIDVLYAGDHTGPCCNKRLWDSSVFCSNICIYCQ